MKKSTFKRQDLNESNTKSFKGWIRMRKELAPEQLAQYNSLIQYIADTDSPFISADASELISCFHQGQKQSLNILSSADLYLRGAHFTNTEIEQIYQHIQPDAVELLFSGYSNALLYGEGALAFFQDITPQIDFSAEQVFGEYLELDFALDGGCDISIGGQTLASSNLPRVRISSQNVNTSEKQIRRYTKDKPVRNVSLWLHPEFLIKHFDVNPRKLKNKLQLTFKQAQAEPISFPITNKITAILEDIFTQPFQGKLAYHYLNAKVAELICLTVAVLEDNPEINVIEDGRLPYNKANSIANALKIIDTNLSRPLNSSTLAEEVGMSRSNLSRSFKNLYGITPHEYQTRKRMEKARQLLEEGRTSVQDVAWQVGYENQSSFGRIYKQHFQCSPSKDKGRALLKPDVNKP